jgi:hypothetical protein
VSQCRRTLKVVDLIKITCYSYVANAGERMKIETGKKIYKVIHCKNGHSAMTVNFSEIPPPSAHLL